MVDAIGSRITQINSGQPASQFPTEGVKIAQLSGASLAPAPVYGTGREGGNSGEIIQKLPAQIKYAPSNLNSASILLNNQSLIESMKAYAIPKQANDVLLKNMLEWYNDARSKASPVLRRKVGAFIHDQKLLIDLHGLQAHPKASKAQQDQARAYVLMAQGNGNRWQNKAVEFLSGLFGGKKPDPKKPKDDDDKKVAVPTEQNTHSTGSQRVETRRANREARLSKTPTTVSEALEQFMAKNKIISKTLSRVARNNPLKPFKMKTMDLSKAPSGFIETPSGDLLFKKLPTSAGKPGEILNASELQSALRSLGLNSPAKAPTQPTKAKPAQSNQAQATVEIKLTEAQKTSNDLSTLPEALRTRIKEWYHDKPHTIASNHNGTPKFNPFNPSDCSKMSPAEAPDGFLRLKNGDLKYKNTVNGRPHYTTARQLDADLKAMTEAKPVQSALSNKQAKSASSIETTQGRTPSNDYSELPEPLEVTIREWINARVKTPLSFRRGEPRLNPLNPTDCSKMPVTEAPDGFLRLNTGELAFKQTVNGQSKYTMANTLDIDLKLMIKNSSVKVEPTQTQINQVKAEQASQQNVHFGESSVARSHRLRRERVSSTTPTTKAEAMEQFAIENNVSPSHLPISRYPDPLKPFQLEHASIKNAPTGFSKLPNGHLFFRKFPSGVKSGSEVIDASKLQGILKSLGAL